MIPPCPYARLTLPVVVCVAAFLSAGCGAGSDRTTLFSKLPASQTGITFVNELPEDSSFNAISYLYYYNGGGVAVGDVDNDGLMDLFFTSNLGSNKLYLNKGNLEFEDITERAGVSGSGNWKTGVTMADVNADGRVDVYVSEVSGYLDRSGRNQLFINNGDGTFTDRARAYGLDLAALGTHATFFDYDGDGDLDVYIVNHSVHALGTFGAANLRYRRHPLAGDRLMRNDGGRFTDVSEQAGIYGGIVGYGLSATVSDLNTDGCPDLYVSNDFHENDYLYLNNCDGTFSETVREAMGHTSRYSMGSDAADINNDGRPDLAVLDMLPERQDILRTSETGESYELYATKVRLGYHDQLTRNTLQLNQGHGRFSDIALLAGVQATDWSWAPLLADYDNDGHNDLFITNGIYRRPNNLDYMTFSTEQAHRVTSGQSQAESDRALLDHMPQVRIPKYAFRNKGDLTFSNVSATWGLDDKSFSNGAAYVDLDNDGDLDLVTNNIDEPASVFENRAEALRKGAHFLTVVLQGSGGNTAGIGAKVFLKQSGRTQIREQIPTRGFESSVDPRLHFGLGTDSTVDTLTVVWPDSRFQVLTNVQAGQVLTLRQTDATGTFDYTGGQPAHPLFQDVTDSIGLDFRHVENAFDDFSRQPLLPHMVSREGPALAVGDVNGDGLEDVFLGGAKYEPGQILLQTQQGKFIPLDEPALRADSLAEDVSAALFDADGDHDLDLVVAHGGNEFRGDAEALKLRLYRNDGAGNFSQAADALPPIFMNASIVAPADFDDDGDTDLFIGGRVVTDQYGASPRSYLLKNDGHGAFQDVTEAEAEGLASPGMVTGAAWSDYDGDGALDLIVVGKWMPVRLFRQQGGAFVEQTEQVGLNETKGWWNTVAAQDMDGDGDVDLVAGNLGLNSKARATLRQPARLYLEDFDENGSLDQILTYFTNGVSYPVASLDQLTRQIEPLREKFVTYAAYKESKVEDLFSSDQLKGARVLEASTLATSYLENQGDGTFQVHELPLEAQLAPVRAILSDDFDGDGKPDLLLAGNFSGVMPFEGRYDASYGTLLLGDGAGGFEPVDPADSNLYLRGEVRHMRFIRQPNGQRVILAARNDDRPQLIRPLHHGRDITSR